MKGGNANTPGTLICARPIAALYVTKSGSYYGLEGVDPWDEERDARLYDGPYPVVAHPPCARWSRLAAFTQARFGYKIGEDGGCFEAALRAVRTYGGVLEHPAYSRAWARFELPKPITGWPRERSRDRNRAAFSRPRAHRPHLHPLRPPVRVACRFTSAGRRMPTLHTRTDRAGGSVTLCECGCGQGVNPRLDLARDMRRDGMPFSKIGEALNCSGAYIKHLLANPPRFLKGHSGRVNHGFGICIGCGNRFAKHGPSQIVCNNRINRECAQARRRVHAEKWARYDAEVEQRRTRRIALVRERRELRRLISGQSPFGNDSFREARLAEVSYQIECLGDELRALYESQQRDDRWSHRGGIRGLFSLDAPIGRNDDGTFYDIHGLEDAVAIAYQSFGRHQTIATDAWTDVVHAVIDRRREIDSWAEEIVA